jgi:hypothetical protein
MRPFGRNTMEFTLFYAYVNRNVATNKQAIAVDQPNIIQIKEGMRGSNKCNYNPTDIDIQSK